MYKAYHLHYIYKYFNILIEISSLSICIWTFSAAYDTPDKLSVGSCDKVVHALK